MQRGEGGAERQLQSLRLLLVRACQGPRTHMPLLLCACVLVFPALVSGGALKTCSTLHAYEPHSIRLL